MGAPRILAPTTISGGIPTAGAGTLNTVALWTPDGFTLGNSLLTQSGSVITNATGAIRANGTTQSTPAFMRYDATTSGIYFPATNEIGFTISSQHAMFISSGRLVGIGTTTPGAQLDVVGTTVVVRARASSTNTTPVLGAEPGMTLRNTNSTVGNYTSITNRDSNDNANGQINFINVNHTGSGAINFVTRDSVGGSAERVRITQTGNVVVGTGSYAGASLGGIRVTNGVNSYVAASDGTRTVFMGADGNAVVGTLTAHDLKIRAGNADAITVQQGTLNVGIGTASPLAQFTLGGIANSTTKMGFQSASTEVGSITMNSATGEQRITAGFAAWGGFQTFYTNGFERARIESNGRFIVAGTGATESLQVNAGFRIAGVANVATAAAAQPGVFSYEYPTTRTYVGDGSGYTWAVSRRSGSVTTDMMYITDNVGSLYVPGADSVFYGVRVGRGAGSVSSNTAVGNGALGVNTTGLQNTALGFNALGAVASGTNNTGLGFGAMVVATGSNNTAVGAGASNNQTTGTNNTSVGHQAGWACTTNSNNVSVGQNTALYQTGYNNTAVGAQAAQGALSASTGHSNTAIGLQAAYALTSGAQNTAVGSQAMYGLQGGSRNTAVGEAALYTNSTGTDSTAVGRYAAVFNTGNNNVAVGSSALNGTSGSSTGGNNVAVGMQSGQSITTGTNNVFVGYVAGSGVTTSTSNTMIGYATASGGTCTGGDNTLVGAVAGNQITTGANNVCIGSNAGQSQTTASDNAYVGKNAGYYQTGGANTAVGRSAMTGSPGVSNGQANAALGNSSLSAITSGSYNVCAGFNAGNNITTGSSNIVLGTDAQTAAAGDSNQLVLGSSARFVATNGGATTYYATAGASLGYIQVRLNGANVKIQVFAP